MIYIQNKIFIFEYKYFFKEGNPMVNQTRKIQFFIYLSFLFLFFTSFFTSDVSADEIKAASLSNSKSANIQDYIAYLGAETTNGSLIMDTTLSSNINNVFFCLTDGTISYGIRPGYAAISTMEWTSNAKVSNSDYKKCLLTLNELYQDDYKRMSYKGNECYLWIDWDNLCRVLCWNENGYVQIRWQLGKDKLSSESEPIENVTIASCNHIWQGYKDNGRIKCSKCSESISDDDIKSKHGIGLSSVEKAKVYWTLNHYMTAKTQSGKYLYSENSAFNLTADEYGVTVKYLKNNIWGTYAYDDYVKYYNATENSTISSSNNSNYKTVSQKDDIFWNALSAAQTLVKGKLKSPTSAKFPASGSEYSISRNGNDYKVTGYVDAQNLFGVVVRVKWSSCFTMRKAGGNNFEITNSSVELFE